MLLTLRVACGPWAGEWLLPATSLSRAGLIAMRRAGWLSRTLSSATVVAVLVASGLPVAAAAQPPPNASSASNAASGSIPHASQEATMKAVLAVLVALVVVAVLAPSASAVPHVSKREWHRVP